ncbi:MAG TPA: LysR family transcriptional regulator [Methylocella sp.]|nr:LysR family transcriptional regulator [Methylocella sp.]
MPAMDLSQLRYVVTAAEVGNFARAAEALRLNTSTISRRIGRLEEELGLTLFERGRSGVRLTPGGRAVIVHVRRVLAELEMVKCAGLENGTGQAGEIRLGVRMPPIGEPVRSLLSMWRELHPKISLTVSELPDRDIVTALEERRLDVALLPSFMLWPHAEALPLYGERLVAAIPSSHPLAGRDEVVWPDLADEIILVQGWAESQAARELYASFLGSGMRFQAHAVSKQSILALVGAGFGVTLAVSSQSEAKFPGVVYKTIAEPNAWLRIDLAWMPETDEPVIGRFVAFMRDEARSRKLV